MPCSSVYVASLLEGLEAAKQEREQTWIGLSVGSLVDETVSWSCSCMKGTLSSPPAPYNYRTAQMDDLFNPRRIKKEKEDLIHIG